MPNPEVHITALVTTYKSLLRVHANLLDRTVVVTTIDSNKGIYFGLTNYRHGALVAVRNLDTSKRRTNAAYDTNVICFYDPRLRQLTPYFHHPILTDLHQIRRYGERLFVILGTGSEIAVFDLTSRELIQRIKLAPWVPPHLRWDDAAHPDDPYHFNSLALNGNSLQVLAHNWDRGSFVLDFNLSFGPPISINYVGVIENLGFAAHDVVVADSRIHTLDGRAGRLISRGNHERIHQISPLHGPPFPRGLSITQEHILFGYGSWSAEPFTRLRSPSRLRVLRRHDWSVVMDGELGLHGNTSDILVLSNTDASDTVRL